MASDVVPDKWSYDKGYKPVNPEACFSFTTLGNRWEHSREWLADSLKESSDQFCLKKCLMETTKMREREAKTIKA